ncbi:MAG: VCBS repeat-containing protein, partial [Candidatus Aenigmarchaeota archaeon]|nr:VCBS repeat-containing protein [Candidatus Aenigmarchaeota archaeon]
RTQTECNSTECELNISWSGVSDQGDDYFYYINAFDDEGNEDNYYNSTGLVGYWKFHEGSLGSANGETTYDETNNDNDGTVYGANWTTGKYGPALEFDGDNDYINCGNNPSLNAANITVEAWVKIDGLTGTTQHILGRSCYGNHKDYRFYVTNGRIPGLDISNGTSNEAINSPDAIALNEWHHIVGTWTPSNKTIYVDGEEKRNQASTLASIGYSGSAALLIGRYNCGGVALNGTIDEVRIYNRSLSADEVRENYHNGKIKNATITTGIKDYYLNGTGLNNWRTTTPQNSSSLSPNTQYCYNLKPRDNADNEGLYSGQSCNYTAAEKPSMTAVNCSGTAGNYYCNVTFDMGNNPGGTQHYINETTGNTNATDQDWTSSETVYQDTGLAAHTQYCYQIKARNNESVETSYTTQTCDTVPNNPPTIEVTAPPAGNTEVDLSYNINWTASDADNDPLNISCYADNDNSGWDVVYTCFEETANDGTELCNTSEWLVGEYYVWCNTTDEEVVAKDYSAGIINITEATYSSDMSVGTLEDYYDADKIVHLTNLSDPWWESDWHYKLPLTVNATTYNRTDYLIKVGLNFTKLFDDANTTGTMCDNCFRVVEYNETTGALLYELPGRFLHPKADYNNATNAYGRVDFVLNGTTLKNEERTFYLFFDKAENGEKSAPSPFNNSQVFFYPETDLDQDGKMEIVVAEHDYGVNIIKWNGTDYVQVYRNNWDIGSYPALAIADVDNNGIPNLLMAYYGNGYVYSIEYNKTSGEYENKYGSSNYALNMEGNPHHLVVGDIDMDGTIEILNPGHGADRSYVYGWNGTSYVKESDLDVTDPSYFGTTNDPYTPRPQIDNQMMGAFGDIDNDGTPEFITQRYTGTGSNIWHYDGEKYVHEEFFETYSAYGGMSILDVDDDGLAEIVTGDTGEEVNIIEYNQQDGSFALKETPDVGHDCMGVMAAADWDGDGVTEFVTGNWYGYAKVFQYDGDTDSYVLKWTSHDYGSYGWTAAFGDVDDDGEIEVIYPRYNSIHIFNSSSGPTNAVPEATFTGNSYLGYQYGDSLLISGMPDPQGYGVGAPKITKGEVQTAPNQSRIDNTGTRNMTAYLTMKVQNQSGASWSEVDTIINILQQNISVGSYINLDSIWEDAGAWNTSNNPDGDYRVYVELTDSGGTILINNDDSTPMNTTYEFEIDSAGPVISDNVPVNGSLIVDPVLSEQNTYEYTWSITTDELAMCRYTTQSGQEWESMMPISSDYETTHYHRLQIVDESSYNFYIKCKDSVGNIGSEYNLHFTTEWNNRPTVGKPTISKRMFNQSEAITLSATCYDIDSGDYGMKDCRFVGTQDGTTYDSPDWKSCTGTSCSCTCSINSEGVGSVGCPDAEVLGDWVYRAECRDEADATDSKTAYDYAIRANVSWGSESQNNVLQIEEDTATGDLTYRKTITIDNTEGVNRKVGWSKSISVTLPSGVDTWSLYNGTTCSGNLELKTPFIVLLDRDGDVVTSKIHTDGSFGELTDYGDYFIGSDDSLDVKIADFNNDGYYDILSGGDSDVRIIAGSAEGTFTAVYTTSSDVLPGDEIRALAAADFDNDGDYDFIGAAEDEQVKFFNNTGGWSFSVTSLANIPAGSYPMCADAADFNNDSNMDFIVQQYGHGTYIYYGNGDGTFGSPTSVDTDNWYSYGLAAADFTGDGLPDYIKGGNWGNGDHYLYT